MAITSSVGVGSGIDINNTVSQLTAAEGKPQLDAIANKTTISQTKLSGLGTLKGALSSFQNAVKLLDQSKAYQAQNITSSDDKVLKVTAAADSTAASHSIKVTALAKAQKSVSNTEFKSTDVVSEGVLLFNDKDGNPKFSVVIKKGENDSLTAVRDAINNAKGNNTVVASIVNVDSKTASGTTVAKLVLTAKTAGIGNSFTVDASMGDSRLALDSKMAAGNYSTTPAVDTSIIIDPQATPAVAQQSVATTEFSSTDVVAPGLISFKDTAGTEKFSVNIIQGRNDKIFAAMDAINNAPGNDSIVASVINTTSKKDSSVSVSKLVFTAKNSGLANKFTIDASQGDSRFTLDSSPVNAQKSASNVALSATDKVAAGTLTFKDPAGTSNFSVSVVADKTITMDSNGNVLPLDEAGNPVIPTDENGNSVTTTTQTIAGNNTLEDLKNAINYNPENKLVRADIVSTTISEVRDDSGNVVTPAGSASKLVLTALSADKGFSVDATAGDSRFGMDSTNYTTTSTIANFDTTEATDAGDGGQVVTRSSTTISDAIPGVTLNLIATGTADVNVQQDTTGIAQPISAFVDAYNKLNDSLKQLTTYVKPGDSGNGPLLGDSVVQNVTTQIKNIINAKVGSATGDYNSLNQLGITFDKKGVMTIDSSVLQTALAKNLTSVGNVFASTNGVATQLNSKLTQFLDAKGSISTEQDNLNKTLTDLTSQKAAVQERLDATQKRLQAQFVAMDTAVAQFKNTGTFLTQYIASKTSTNN